MQTLYLTVMECNQAQEFSRRADEALTRGQLQQAMEMHFRAAEQYLKATSYTSDPEGVKSLTMLSVGHSNKGKELKRRIESLEKDQAVSVIPSGGTKVPVVTVVAPVSSSPPKSGVSPPKTSTEYFNRLV